MPTGESKRLARRTHVRAYGPVPKLTKTEVQPSSVDEQVVSLLRMCLLLAVCCTCVRVRVEFLGRRFKPRRRQNTHQQYALVAEPRRGGVADGAKEAGQDRGRPQAFRIRAEGAPHLCVTVPPVNLE